MWNRRLQHIVHWVKSAHGLHGCALRSYKFVSRECCTMYILMHAFSLRVAVVMWNRRLRQSIVGERRYAASQEMPFVSLVHLCYACIQDLLFVALSNLILKLIDISVSIWFLSEETAAKLLFAEYWRSTIWVQQQSYKCRGRHLQSAINALPLAGVQFVEGQL